MSNDSYIARRDVGATAFNWIEYTPTETRVLTKIFNDEIKSLRKRHGREYIRTIYPHRRISENDLQTIIDEYPSLYGHTVQDEMNIRLGRATITPTGDVIPSDKFIARQLAQFNKREREESQKRARNARRAKKRRRLMKKKKRRS